MIQTGREGEREWGYDYAFMPTQTHPEYRKFMSETWMQWLMYWTPTRQDWVQ